MTELLLYNEVENGHMEMKRHWERTDSIHFKNVELLLIKLYNLHFYYYVATN